MPNVIVDIHFLHIPKNIPLADPEFHQQNKIDILIGTDCFWSILAHGRIALGRNLPVTQNTHFGLIISGLLSAQSKNSVRSHVACKVLGD